MEDFKPSYIAFIDVLGFSNLIARGKEFENIFKGYIKIIRNTIDWVDKKNFTYSVFSDTIIIFASNSQLATLEKLIEIVSRISYALIMEHGVPVKGAIAHGRFTNFVEEQDRILAGTPIVEAYRYEQKQNWIGQMLCPSVIRNVPDILNKTQLFSIDQLSDNAIIDLIKKNKKFLLTLCAYDIPFKQEKFQGIAIIPKRLNSTDPYYVCQDLQEQIEKLKILKLQAEDPYVQIKYINTELFLTKMLEIQTNLYSNKNWQKAFWDDTKGLLTPKPRGN